MKPETFNYAKPIWLSNNAESKNVHLMLHTEVKKNSAELICIATSEFYQLFINGVFKACGPARAGRGYFRVDKIEIGESLDKENNIIEIILFSYGVDCYSNINQDPFVSCEITNEGKCICATGYKNVFLYRLTNYVQSISKYSLQRGFVESYIISDEHLPVLADTKICSDKKYIARNVPYPMYEKLDSMGFIYSGAFHTKKKEKYKMLLAEEWGPENCMQFSQPEENTTNELQEFVFSDPVKICSSRLDLSSGKYAISSFTREGTGMISFKCTVHENCVLYVTYDEILTENNTVNAQRLSCNAVVKYRLKKGEYNLVSFEPVSMKYICFSVVEGKVGIDDIKLIEYKHPSSNNSTDIPDKALKLIYNAAVETFRQNSIDIFMDCPSRERAGWLCDSYFTARTEKYITGKNIIEKNFLENFLMENIFKYLPDGMLPMCYPADHHNGSYIPNWAMWFVLELADYSKRSGDAELIVDFKKKVFELIRFFEKYENNDGLLESLDKWVFVDWSESNKNVRDVSFPSNMMYAYMLEAASGLYGKIELKRKAEKIKKKIRELSFDGKFFCDNLLKTETGYKKSGVCTESCQYYAFFTGTATREMYPRLWETLINDFGFDRATSNKYPDIPPSNAFIGNYIRLELLLREELYAQLLKEVKGYFTYMAERTGTLWEKVDATASMNHGFASYAAVWIGEAIKNLRGAAI